MLQSWPIVRSKASEECMFLWWHVQCSPVGHIDHQPLIQHHNHTTDPLGLSLIYTNNKKYLKIEIKSARSRRYSSYLSNERSGLNKRYNIFTMNPVM